MEKYSQNDGEMYLSERDDYSAFSRREITNSVYDSPHESQPRQTIPNRVWSAEASLPFTQNLSSSGSDVPVSRGELGTAVMLRNQAKHNNDETFRMQAESEILSCVNQVSQQRTAAPVQPGQFLTHSAQKNISSPFLLSNNSANESNLSVPNIYSSVAVPLSLDPISRISQFNATPTTSNFTSAMGSVPLLRPAVPIQRRRTTRKLGSTAITTDQGASRSKLHKTKRHANAPIARMKLGATIGPVRKPADETVTDVINTSYPGNVTQNSTPTHVIQEFTQTTSATRGVLGSNACSISPTRSVAVGGSSSTPISAQEKQITTDQPQKDAALVPGRHRSLPTGGGVVAKSGISELVAVAKEIRMHIVQWREEDASQRKQDSAILQQILDQTRANSHATTEVPMPVATMGKSMDIVAAVNIAQSFVKLHTLMGFSPLSDSAQIYATSAYPMCPIIQAAARFALTDDDDEQILTFINNSLPKARRSNGGGSVLSAISRGQSRAHECVQRDIVAIFLQFCPKGCPLRTTSAATAEEKSQSAKEIVESSAHKTSPSFNAAWYHASQIARMKARLAAESTYSDLKSARPDSQIPPPWVKSEQDACDETFQMTVCSFAFIVTKVTFALQRIFATTAKRKELRKSHQIPWACEALRIDSLLATQDKSKLRIGKITFHSRLSAELRNTLNFMASRPSSTSQSS